MENHELYTQTTLNENHGKYVDVKKEIISTCSSKIENILKYRTSYYSDISNFLQKVQKVLPNIVYEEWNLSNEIYPVKQIRVVGLNIKSEQILSVNYYRSAVQNITTRNIFNMKNSNVPLTKSLSVQVNDESHMKKVFSNCNPGENNSHKIIFHKNTKEEAKNSAFPVIRNFQLNISHKETKDNDQLEILSKNTELEDEILSPCDTSLTEIPSKNSLKTNSTKIIEINTETISEKKISCYVKLTRDPAVEDLLRLANDKVMDTSSLQNKLGSNKCESSSSYYCSSCETFIRKEIVNLHLAFHKSIIRKHDHFHVTENPDINDKSNYKSDSSQLANNNASRMDQELSETPIICKPFMNSHSAEENVNKAFSENNSSFNDITKAKEGENHSGYSVSINETLRVENNSTSKNFPETTDNITKCRYCLKNFNQSFDLEAHEKSCQLSDIFQCKTCGRRFSDSRTLEEHALIRENHEEVCSKKPSKDGSNSSNSKSNQKKKSLAEKKLKISSKNENKEITCQICKKNFNQLKDFEEHRTNCRSRGKFQCSICNRYFPSISAMKRHKEKCLDTISCSYCFQRFRYRTCLELHENKTCKVKLPKEVMLCDQCGKVIKGRRNIRIHCQKHEREQEFQCDICFKIFPTEIILETHIRHHTGEKPFKCPECSQNFVSYSALNVHKRIKHMNVVVPERTYECDLCNNKYKTKQGLIIHIRCHTGEKPFKCKECSKCFRTEYSLQLHKKFAHTNEKIYQCDHCDKKFVTKYNMKIHTQSHFKEKKKL